MVPLRLLAVGPVPPPVNGLSKAFSFIIQGLPAAGWAIRVIDTADREVPRAASSFSLARLPVIFRVLVAALLAAPPTDLVYVTIAPSRGGSAQDMVLDPPPRLFGPPGVAPVLVHRLPWAGGARCGGVGGVWAGDRERVLRRDDVGDRVGGHGRGGGGLAVLLFGGVCLLLVHGQTLDRGRVINPFTLGKAAAGLVVR